MKAHVMWDLLLFYQHILTNGKSDNAVLEGGLVRIWRNILIITTYIRDYVLTTFVKSNRTKTGAKYYVIIIQ